MNSTRWLIIFLCVLTFGSCNREQPAVQEDIPRFDSLLVRGIEDTRKLNFEEAQSGLSQLLLEAKSQKSKKYQVLANLNLGNLYHHFNLEDEALKYFLYSLELAEESGQNQLLNSIYNNIGIIYAKNKAYTDAERYFRLALAISRKQGFTTKVGMNLINLGITLEEHGKDAEAIQVLNEASQIFTGLKDSTNLGAIENALGNIFYNKEDYIIALQYYRNAIRLIPQDGPVWFNAEYSSNIGKTYLQFNEIDSARKYVELAKEVFEKMDDTSLLVEANMILSNTERKAGNTNLALNYFEEAMRLKDKLIDEKTSKWVSERQLNYEFGKKEKELELLRLDSERQRTIWIGSVVGGTLILILLVLILRTKIQNLRQKNIILEQDKQVIQLTVEKNAVLREKMQQELKNKEQVNAVERAKLQQEIDFRNRELVTKALHIVNKNETISAIDHLLANYDELLENQKEKVIADARNMLRFEKNLDDDWETFKLHFEEVHPDFFVSLTSKNRELNSGDLRMCAYLRLDLNTKEIAKIFNISPDSVRKRKQRLKEKLNISSESDLNEWLRSGYSVK